MTCFSAVNSDKESLASLASRRHIQNMPFARLNRTVFRLSGEGVEEWLSGLITNEISDSTTFAALLTPQGKIIADFFIYRDGDTLLLDTPSKFAADLHKRLRMYRLRAPIEIEETGLTITAVWDMDEMDGTPDPRHPSLGNRIVSPSPKNQTGDYNAHRLSLGVPDSEWDFETQELFPADANMDLLNGVNFSKGCFVGQEVVSRMKRMTTVKKRMRGIVFSSELGPTSKSKVFKGSREIGWMMHSHQTKNLGMAMIRLNRMDDAEGEIQVHRSPVQVMNAVDGLDH